MDTIGYAFSLIHSVSVGLEQEKHKRIVVSNKRGFIDSSYQVSGLMFKRKCYSYKYERRRVYDKSPNFREGLNGMSEPDMDMCWRKGHSKSCFMFLVSRHI